MVKSIARMTIELAHDMCELLPLQPHKGLQPNANPVEAALDLNKDMLRRLLGVVRMNHDHLHSEDSADDEGIDELV